MAADQVDPLRRDAGRPRAGQSGQRKRLPQFKIQRAQAVHGAVLGPHAGQNLFTQGVGVRGEGVGEQAINRGGGDTTAGGIPADLDHGGVDAVGRCPGHQSNDDHEGIIFIRTVHIPRWTSWPS